MRGWVIIIELWNNFAITFNEGKIGDFLPLVTLTQIDSADGFQDISWFACLKAGEVAWLVEKAETQDLS